MTGTEEHWVSDSYLNIGGRFRARSARSLRASSLVKRNTWWLVFRYWGQDHGKDSSAGSLRTPAASRWRRWRRCMRPRRQDCPARRGVFPMQLLSPHAGCSVVVQRVRGSTPASDAPLHACTQGVLNSLCRGPGHRPSPLPAPAFTGSEPCARPQVVGLSDWVCFSLRSL